MTNFNDLQKCSACGMLITPQEYHPYPACVLYRQTQQSEKVQNWLESIVQYGMEAESKGISLKEALTGEK